MYFVISRGIFGVASVIDPTYTVKSNLYVPLPASLILGFHCEVTYKLLYIGIVIFGVSDS